jgi:hypothetical protein
MFGSIVAVIVAGALNVGSIGKAFEIAGDGDRLHLFEMSPGEEKTNVSIMIPKYCLMRKKIRTETF